MNKEVQSHNTIFRDTVLGVLFLMAALVSTLLTGAYSGTLLTAFIVLNGSLAMGGAYLLQKAFKSDKHRLQTT